MLIPFIITDECAYLHTNHVNFSGLFNHYILEIVIDFVKNTFTLTVFAELFIFFYLMYNFSAIENFEKFEDIIGYKLGNQEMGSGH